MSHGQWELIPVLHFWAQTDYSRPHQICPFQYIFSSFANENIVPGLWVDARMRELEDHEVAFLNQFTGLYVTFWCEMMCCHDNSPCAAMQRHVDSRRAWHQRQPSSRQQNWYPNAQISNCPVKFIRPQLETLCTPSSRSPDWLVEVGETLRHDACKHVFHQGPYPAGPWCPGAQDGARYAGPFGFLKATTPELEAPSKHACPQALSMSLYFLRRTDTWSLKSTGSRRNWEWTRGM